MIMMIVNIYIITDSVYEVSSIISKNDNDKPLRKETDSVRPKSLEEKEQLREFDEYGDDKLSCEEILIQQQERGGFPWVSLRFADVIGPRDTLPRWFFYHIWIKLYTNIGEVVPFYIPDDVMD